MQVEFPVSHDALLPLGTTLNAAHFVAGQHVDVTAVTKGKGFAGVMKKWGFKGQSRTHGHSLSHRSIGSIGMQGYARVLPGRKMAGKMGNRRRVQLNCWVSRYEIEHRTPRTDSASKTVLLTFSRGLFANFWLTVLSPQKASSTIYMFEYGEDFCKYHQPPDDN